MSDGLFSKRSSLNTDAIPESAEELSQRYEKIFQQYSRLKAQHAVLKKAVIKEQATNVTLQGNVKEKEKELRKLQEQLDLLSFHNERLTKRIQAVQENDQKTSHFSLLGGSTKRILKESTQALDATHFDLEHKIQDNERLHQELADKKAKFEESEFVLLKKIQHLEQQIQQLTMENNGLLDASSVPRQDHQDLDLEKGKKWKEDCVSEIRSLRTILFSKMEESSLLENVLNGTELSLKDLEDQAEKYLESINNKDSQIRLELLPYEIAEKLKISHETWRKELEMANAELKDNKRQLDDFLAKEQEVSPFEIQTKQLNDKHKEEIKRLEEKYTEKTTQINTQYENQLRDCLLDIEENRRQIQKLETINEEFVKENARLKQEIGGIHINRQPRKDNETQTDTMLEKEKIIGSEKDILYPNKDSVYTGVDTVLSTAEQEKEEEIGDKDKIENETKEENPEIKETVFMMRVFYEQQIKNMNEKLQHTDTKASKFSDMYKSSKIKLDAEEKDRLLLQSEIERLNKEVKHVQDLLSTTESNYQKQLDTMTEFMVSIEEQRSPQ